MKIHLIAIGGAVMHNLAIALKASGNIVSGSDDDIKDPSKSRLIAAGLYPEQLGWFENRITSDLDCVILGMHARNDNPELAEAKKLNIPIYSFPEFIYNQSIQKKRVVIGGSHGKTSITSMIMHILKWNGVAFDYMVGSNLEGFTTMVQLSQAPIIILEGDEYLSSPIDRRPKFHLYHPHIAVISGIAHDHINVFPTKEIYREQFSIFIDKISKDEGVLIYYKNDEELLKAIKESKSLPSVTIPYMEHNHYIKDGITYLQITDGSEVPLTFFGSHNMANFNAAFHVCISLGLFPEQIYKAIASFKGASRRLELIAGNGIDFLYRDFAHSPSKLRATVQSVKKQFPHHHVIGVMELHTFSSLNKDFLQDYAHSMDVADEAIVYFNSSTLEHKKLLPLDKDEVKEAFKNKNLIVYNDARVLQKYLDSIEFQHTIVLLMSSGSFDGLNLQTIIQKIKRSKTEVI